MVNCNKCKYIKKCEIPSTVIAMWDKCMAFKPKQTNADRIRSMTDEELAEFISGIDSYWDDGQLIIRVEDCALNDSLGDILEWLQSEAE